MNTRYKIKNIQNNSHKISLSLIKKGICFLMIALIALNNSGCRSSSNNVESKIIRKVTNKHKGLIHLDYTYMVHYGDTLESIAEAFDTTVEAIKEKNGITDININQLVASDIIIPIWIDKQLITTSTENNKNTTIEYIVQDGDTLGEISHKFGISIDNIKSLNDLSSNYIEIGDTLIIPINKDSEKYLKYSNSYDLKNEKDLIKSIDISSNNGPINWDVIEQLYNNNDISFVILKMSENYDPYTDERNFSLDNEFEKNLSECNKRNIPYFIYVVTHSTTNNDVNNEAHAIINYIQNRLNTKQIINNEEYDLTFAPSGPLYYDIGEEGELKRMIENGYYDAVTNLVELWCNLINNAGIVPGIYCNIDTYKNLTMDYARKDMLEQYSFWLADYKFDGKQISLNDNNNYSYTFNDAIDIIQISNQCFISGASYDEEYITVYFDLNVAKPEILKINKTSILKRTQN